VANQRIMQGAAATLTFLNVDSDGTATDAGGALTVGVTRADGTVLVAAGTATTHGVTGTYTYALAAANTLVLDLLAATWTDASTGATHVTYHEIVGGYLFTIAEIRAFDILSDTVKFTTANVITERSAVEDELEQIRNAAFVPRYARLILDGSGDHDIVTGKSWLRRVRSVKVLASTGSSTSTTFTAAQLAACVVTEDGRIRRGDGDVFEWGVGNIVVELEHGFTDWGNDLKIAALNRLRERLGHTDTAIPDRATNYQSVDGYSYGLAAPNANSTGNPYVDSVYARYPRPDQGQTAASRQLVYQPQSGGVFRGWPVST
jgi:hypothetical protein